MEFRTGSQDLSAVLSQVTRALSARPAKQVLEGVLIDAQDGMITLTCSDGTLTIESSLPAEVLTPGRAVLPGRLFTELVRKLPAGQVIVRSDDNQAARLSCMGCNSRLSGMNPMEFPEMSRVTDGCELRLPQNRLRDMINHVVFAIATDESRQILTGCLLEVTADEARLVALDGFRLAIQRESLHFDLPEGKEQVRVVIPGRVCNELSRILTDSEDDCVLTFDHSRIEASFGQTRLNAVLLAGEFIDYRRIVPKDFRTVAITKKADMADAIDRASLMAREGKNNLVKMSYQNDQLKITSNAELGLVEETMQTTLQGDGIDIAFNARYIADIISRIGDEDIQMKFNTSVSPCVITPVGGEGSYLYLILPVRVFQ